MCISVISQIEHVCKQYEVFTSYKIAAKMLLDCEDRTDQDLHCSTLILSHITLNGVMPDQIVE